MSNKNFSLIVQIAKKRKEEFMIMLDQVKKIAPERMQELALYIEKKLLEQEPDIDKAELRIFAEIITGVAGTEIRKRQEEIARELELDLPDCLRSHAAFESTQTNNEKLLKAYNIILDDWIKQGARDPDGSIEYRITYLKMFAATNNLMIPIPKKDLTDSKKRNFASMFSIK